MPLIHYILTSKWQNGSHSCLYTSTTFPSDVWDKWHPPAEINSRYIRLWCILIGVFNSEKYHNRANEPIYRIKTLFWKLLPTARVLEHLLYGDEKKTLACTTLVLDIHNMTSWFKLPLFEHLYLKPCKNSKEVLEANNYIYLSFIHRSIQVVRI